MILFDVNIRRDFDSASCIHRYIHLLPNRGFLPFLGQWKISKDATFLIETAAKRYIKNMVSFTF